MSQFNELGLSEPILKVLSEIGFENPTEIQEQAIPMLLQKDGDFIGLAQTGTGKTAAFGLPLLDKIDFKQRRTEALILAPTRELGKQIADQLILFSKYFPKLNVMAVYGGTNIVRQMNDIKRDHPHILIATPGRLLDLVDRGVVKLEHAKYVVLDEADEMLNMGFKEDIDKILSFTPEEKQTWLFSATMPKEIRKIVDKYMDDPGEVAINPKDIVNKNISHQYVVVDGRQKNEHLMRFIDATDEMRGIIFCRTRLGTQNLAEILIRNNYKADAIHGDLSQQQRDKVMRRFKDNQLQILVATDVAARGIDVDNLTHVMHHALPDDLPYYTHRSGRTARAGKTGISLSFVSKGEVRKLKQIERSLKLKLEEVEAPSKEDILERRMQAWSEKFAALEPKTKNKEEIFAMVNSYFESFTKEEVIAKFASIEVEKFLARKQDGGNSGDRGGDRGGDRRDRSRGDRGGRGDRDRGRGRDSRDSRDRGRGDRDRGGRDSRDRGRGDRDSRGRGDRDRGGRDSRDRGDARRSDSRDRDSRGSRDGRDSRESREGRSTRDRKNREVNSDGVRFFINMGRVDGVEKRDLVEFVSKYGKIPQGSIDNVTLGDKFAFFNVDKKETKGIEEKFENLKVKGRDIRMNKDS